MPSTFIVMKINDKKILVRKMLYKFQTITDDSGSSASCSRKEIIIITARSFS